MRTSTQFGGLSYFCTSFNKIFQDNWRYWPHFAKANDDGSDEVSLRHALEYFDPVKCNTTSYRDTGHRCNNDFWNTCSEMDCKPLCLMLLIDFNLSSGPDDQDLRYSQLKQAPLQHMHRTTYATSPCFRACSSDLREEWREALLEDEGESTESALWRHIFEYIRLEKKGYKSYAGRHMDFVHAGEIHYKRWFTRGFQLQIACIEYNMITKKQIPRVLTYGKGADVEAANEMDSTDRKKVTTVDRTLRSCGMNAAVMALALHGEVGNYRVLVIAVLHGKVVKNWYAYSNTECRDVLRAQKWLLLQAETGTGQHLYDILEVVLDPEFLRAARFLSSSEGALLKMTQDEVDVEEEFAYFAIFFGLTLFQNRAVSTLDYVYGYPWAYVLDLSAKGENASQMWRNYKLDNDVYKAVKARAVQTKEEKDWLYEHPFNKVVNQQMLLACEEVGYKHEPEKTTVITRNTKTLPHSPGVEEINNYQKNSIQMRLWGGRYRRPPVCLATTIRGKLLSTRMRYETVKLEAIEPSTPFLSPTDFCPTTATKMPFNLISSTTQKAPYYSPAAKNISKPTAGLVLGRDLYAKKALGAFGSAKHGWFCKASHAMIFRKRAGEMNSPIVHWSLGVHHFEGSSCIVLPCEMKVVPGNPGKRYIEFPRKDAATLVSITSMVGIECFGVAPHSWAWQLQNLNSISAHLPPALRLFIDTEMDNPLHLAADNAFYNIALHTLEWIASDIGCDYAAGDNVVQILFKLVKFVTKYTDAKVYTVLEKRFTALSRMCKHSGELLQVDEAAQCLTDEDQRKVHAEQDKATEALQELQQYRKDYKEHRAAHVKATGGCTKKVVEYKGPKKVNYNHLNQKTCKLLLPPGGLLWRRRGMDTWCSRYKELPTREAKDSAHGSEAGALLQCLRHTWCWYLDMKGFERTACPITDLFDDHYDAGAAAGAAKAS